MHPPAHHTYIGGRRGHGNVCVSARNSRRSTRGVPLSPFEAPSIILSLTCSLTFALANQYTRSTIVRRIASRQPVHRLRPNRSSGAHVAQRSHSRRLRSRQMSPSSSPASLFARTRRELCWRERTAVQFAHLLPCSSLTYIIVRISHDAFSCLRALVEHAHTIVSLLLAVVAIAPASVTF